ncbi:hypothetical protein [Dyella sp. 20L07]|uniref:hypothetical protein n=1 Tax=Dyella sp. 20L07 TaxID=3384240 RepID=UPI003D2D8BBB
MSFVVSQTAYRRGRILRILAESNNTGASAPMVRTLVRDWGYKADSDTVAIDLSWLAQHGFAELREISGVSFAKISQAGREIVSGDRDVPGITILED